MSFSNFEWLSSLSLHPPATWWWEHRSIQLPLAQLLRERNDTWINIFCSLMMEDRVLCKRNRSLIVLKNHNFRVWIDIQVRQHSLQPNNFLCGCSETRIFGFSKWRSDSWLSSRFTTYEAAVEFRDVDCYWSSRMQIVSPNGVSITFQTILHTNYIGQTVIS